MSNRVPLGWATPEIGDILQPLADGRTIHQGWSPRCEKGPSVSDEEWGVLKTTAIQAGEFLAQHNKRLPSTLEPRPHLEVKSGDLLLTCAGPRSRCGVACIVKNTRPKLMISGKMYHFRFDTNSILPEYIEAYLQGHSAWTDIDKMKTGVSDIGLNLTQSRFRRLTIPVAPLAQQERIVGAIAEHFSRLDAVEHDVTQGRAKGATLPSVALPCLFSTDWPTRRIGELARVGSGATPKRSEVRYWSGGTIPWVTSGAVNERTISSASEFITEEALAETSVKLWPVGTVLVAMYGEGKTRGKAALLKIESTCNQACAAIDYDRSLVSGNYLLAFLNSQYEASRKLASGGVQPNLSLSLIKGMEIPVPSLETQRSVALQAEDIVLGSEQLVTTCAMARHHVTALRRSILAAAFSGQLVPQDRSDEPAAVLLERIAASRAPKPNRRASAGQVS